jgi:beta-glucosidase
MTSYNLINGIHASQNDFLINKILKDEWGFEGFVMSDWTSTYDGIAAAKAGLDLEMPSGIHMCKDTLLPAIRNGSISAGIIDDKIKRILRTYERFNFFEKPDISKDYIPDSSGIRQTAIDAARGGIVLLKNENNFLPLNKSAIKSIAIIGPNTYPAVTGGGGSSYIEPLHPLSFFEAMKQLAGNEVKITCETGNYERELLPSEFFDRSDFYTYVDGKKVPGMKVDYYLKWWMENTPAYSEVFTKINNVFNDTILGIPRDEFSAKFTGYLKIDKDGLYNFVVSSDGGYILKIDDKDILGSWRNPGETARTALVTLETGKEYKIALMYFQHHRKTGVIRMNYESPESYEQHIAQTLKKVTQAVMLSDLTILSVGFNKDMEHEGNDRSFSLPYEQIRLINEVVKTKKDYIVVLNAGGNVDMSNWLDKSKALIHAWYPGQEGSLAIAEILFGITNPSGKLPVSFEKRWEDNATFNSYYDTDGDKHVRYSEGIFMGYRHFDKENIEPQFPFGFGLSYTTFEYSDLAVNKKSFSENDPIEISLMVKNNGKYNGAEIVQLYIGDPVSSLPRPVKELKAFYKVWLNAGESKKVNFSLNADAFQYFTPEMKKWIEEPGDFDILIGSSSRDIRLKQRIILK